MTDPSTRGDADVDTTGTDTTGMDTMEPHTTASALTGRPRIRWAGIVWGLAFAALAVAGLVLTTSPNAYSALVEWVHVLSVATMVATALLAAGAALLVAGLVGLLRRGQRLLAARRDAAPRADHVTETLARHTT